MTRLEKAIQDIQNGIPVVLVDDFDREFEGDIVLAAEKATKYNLNFAMRHARGLMCLPCFKPLTDRLEIPMMHTNKNDKFGTPFTVSIDSVEGTTGMSVEDRLKTIGVLLNDNSKPSDLCQPGHLFPLSAKPGLLKERRGHTEGSVELMKMAGLKEVAVIIEIMGEDGMMIKGEKLEDFAKIYNLQLISIEEIYEAQYGHEVVTTQSAAQ
jgi:3,4-dihydroxy 2-butanone 4-phosphate synthase/GTP cyclohydrolase II